MTQFIFANNAKSTLAAPASPSATTITLFTGDGALFPSPAAGQQFAVSLLDQANATQREIMYCTHRAGDVLTVTRAQEGTSAGTWVIGDFVNCFITAGQAAAFAQSALIVPQGGSTAARPNPPPYLWFEYFDTDKGFPVWCNQLTPSVTWVSASGAPST